MTLMQWLSGPNGHLFSAFSIGVILMLMIFMSLKIHASYRSKSIYTLLIGTLGAMIADQGLKAYLASSAQPSSEWLPLASMLLTIITFIIINFVFMKLYTLRTAKVKIMPFILMIAAGLALGAVQLFLGSYSTAEQAGKILFPMLDVYSIVVVLVILLATRSVDMNVKYYASLITVFVAELMRMADGYVFKGEQPWAILLVQLLPLLYCCLLFMLLFEWVIDRLLSTYQSAIADGLTGLYIRRHFNKKANQLMERGGIAIIFCDIDNFKRLNDTEGHAKADTVLKRVADILKEESSGLGHAGRYGGEELLACIRTEGCKPDQVAENIRKRVEAETIVTVSIGYSTVKTADSVELMVKQADDAMYYSKTTGKNKVTAYKASLPTAKGSA
ncbi:diguanylate cyclase [Paenibacillus oryzae]|uniref:Diguanylate cyclase n=1 Tax=Paenibacillus oryzae TaxID=1844972 RepID=A0A1A5YHD2_9BACL|nr:GGDEF domain-containing protein [Paenibacillus oryzae]OBR65071.1 diguanylate cyclase [Paenibacillus oryzae]